MSDRLTLSLPVLNAARLAVFVAVGAAKSDATALAVAGDPRLPAGRVQPAGGLVWIVDAAAGANVSR